MATVCKDNMCSGCGLCCEICKNNAINIVDGLNSYNAIIDTNKCVSCGLCYRMCPNNSHLEKYNCKSWYQGWAENREIRMNSSSGGFATAISESFIKDGGVVCSCVFEFGDFIFDFAEGHEELSKFIGSKYVKSNPRGVYRAIKDRLRKGDRVLFVGLPCQVAAVKRYVGANLATNLYTIDLICHGTPSPELLKLFLNQYEISIKELSKISFRQKQCFQVEGNEKTIVTNGVSDRYSTAFLNGLTYTENCYSCIYAQNKRVSDLTIGDSWGTTLPESEVAAGISLVLCMTEKGAYLLNISSLHLEAVDLDNAIANNHQLEHPMKMPTNRNIFFEGIKNGGKFNNLVYKCLPKQCLRQDIKNILLKLHLWGGKLEPSYQIMINYKNTI